MKKVFLILLVLFLFQAGSVLADEAEETLFQKCKACHTNNVEGVEFRGPQLGGFSKSYILNQLHNFKESRRGAGSPFAGAMADAVKNLSDGELEELAGLASSLDTEETIKSEPDSESQGAILYNERCEGCHSGFIGLGRVFTGSPTLDYLEADYIERQLNHFAHDHRGFREPDKHQLKMQAVVKKLSTEELGSILDFLRRERTGE